MPAGRKVPNSNPETVAKETLPRDQYVYCKGCGTELESRSRMTKPRVVVDVMMCEGCQEVHGHPLVPAPGAPTFCYRCGTAEEVFTEPAMPPITYHVCPQCLNDRANRYRAGDFAEPELVEETVNT